VDGRTLEVYSEPFFMYKVSNWYRGFPKSL